MADVAAASKDVRLYRPCNGGRTIKERERARTERRHEMEWDLGLRGAALLLAMSLGFGLIAHLVAARSTTRWVGLIAAAVYFVGGLFTSEVWFGWATEEDLQPNIDGLSFDEVLLITPLFGIAAVLVTRFVTRRHRPPTEPRGPAPLHKGPTPHPS
jgi:hypothetical protein